MEKSKKWGKMTKNNLNWDWERFWGWFGNLSTEYKTYALKELNRDDWLAGLPSGVQVEVMQFAPEEIILAMPKFPNIFKIETIRRIRNY